MPIDDLAKTALVNNVSNIVRASHVQVDVQRLALVFRMSIDELEPGAPIELEGMFRYMVDGLAVAEKDALEVCIIIASRKEKLGFAIQLPAMAQSLSLEAIEAIAGVADGKKESSTLFANKREADQLAGKQAEAAWEPDKKKRKGPKRQTVLMSTLGTTGIAAIAFYGWMFATAVPPLVQLAVPENGLACMTIVTNGKLAICTISSASFNGMREETLSAKATITRTALRMDGVSELWIKTAENNKIVYTR